MEPQKGAGVKQKNPWHRKTILFILFLFILGVVALVSVAVIQNKPLPENIKYGIVLDAGSSHTSVYIYSWPGEKENDTGIVQQFGACNVEGPGISSYAYEVEKAGQSLKKCMDKAKMAIPWIRHSETPLYLGATAGMRLLRLQNGTLSDSILASVEASLRRYPFSFRGARIISGQEEGAYGWITINYLLGTFQQDSSYFNYLGTKDTYGALDLGGASTQITFVPKGPIESEENGLNFRLYGRDYTVYTHSFLCYGKDQALRLMLAQTQQEFENNTIKSPCFNRDFEKNYSNYSSPCTAHLSQSDMGLPETLFVTGTGEADQCRENIQKLFNFSACSFSNCAFNGIYQPKVFGKFGAFSAFFYVMRFLNVTGNQKPSSLETVRERAKDFCSRPWQEVKVQYPNVKEKYLTEYCFAANYILTLLEHGYRFSSETWENIEFMGKIKGSDAGWTLGYMLNLTNMIPSESPPYPPLSNACYITAMVLFSLFLVVLILIGCFCFRKTRGATGKYRI